MGKVVDLTIPTDQFALPDTFDAVPDATFETVPVAAHGPRGSMAFLLASSSATDRIKQSIQSDETVEAVTHLSGNGEHHLYRVSWRARIRVVLGVFLQTSGSLVNARGRADRWSLRILFPEQESISMICENWRNHGIDPSIQRVIGVSGMFGCGGLDLSQCQHETLRTAFEMGYYEVPRDITLDDLAEELQVSHQALSERLRRGHRNLIETTLCESSRPLKNSL